MTPEERSMLERTLSLAKENNEILRKMRRANRFSLVMKIAYWVLIIGLSIGAYYFLESFMDSLVGIYGDIGSGGNVQGAANSLRDLLK